MLVAHRLSLPCIGHAIITSPLLYTLPTPAPSPINASDQRKPKAQDAFPAPRARGKGKGKGKGKGGWQGGIPTASTAAAAARGGAGGAKRAKVVVDEGAKAVNGLRNNLKKAAERAIGSAEAECDAIGDGTEPQQCAAVCVLQLGRVL